MLDSVGLLKKLQIRSGARLWLINVPEHFAEALTAGAEVEPVHMGDAFDAAIAFCRNPSEAGAFASQILPALPADGLLWFGYRKGDAARQSGLSRDSGWDVLAAAGYTPVRSIAFDEEWTGLRFRHARFVKR
jgi:hypothetical protein